MAKQTPPRSTRDTTPDKFVKIFRIETRDVSVALDAIAKLGWTTDTTYNGASPRGTIGIYSRGSSLSALVQRGAAFSLLEIPKTAAA